MYCVPLRLVASACVRLYTACVGIYCAGIYIGPPHLPVRSICVYYKACVCLCQGLAMYEYSVYNNSVRVENKHLASYEYY